MGKKYMETKKDSLESSILGIWQEAAKKEELTKKQKQLDVDGDGEIEGSDLAKLRKKGAKKEGLEDSPNKANSQHLCAKNVVHEEWGEGHPVHGMHADPDADGNIAWYDVMFEHGIERGVSINELKVNHSEMHEKHKKDKNKLMAKKSYKEEVEVDESYEIGTNEYRDHTLEVTPGQSNVEWAKVVEFKVQSMKEALAKVWSLDEFITKDGVRRRVSEGDKRRSENNEKKDLTKVLKNGKTMTGKKSAGIDMKPKIED